MEVFSASLSVEPSQEAEFRAQFEQTTERWGESPQFLWSSLLSSADANSKFIVCTGWNTSDNQAFNEGLGTLKQFQQMFGRVEEFQSIDTFENLPEVQTNETSSPVEHAAETPANSNEAEPESEELELPIDLQTGIPLNWTGNDESFLETPLPISPPPPLRKAESTTMLAEFIGQSVSVWSLNVQPHFHAATGVLIACDEHWAQIYDSEGQTLLFPTAGVRLVKIHE